jgi:cellulose biosynthesis protein BcsQ
MLITIAGGAQAGKTTLTAIVVDELARQGYPGRLLVVELDPAYGLARALEVPPAGGLFGQRATPTAQELADQPGHYIAASGSIARRHLPGLAFDLLTLAHQRDLADRDRLNPALLLTLERLRPDYDLILLDGATDLAPLDPLLLDRSDLLALVLTAASSAEILVRQLRRTLALLEQDSQKVWLIYNRGEGDPGFVADRNLIRLPACPDLTPPLNLTLEVGHPLRWGVQPLLARLWPAGVKNLSVRAGVSG